MATADEMHVGRDETGSKEGLPHSGEPSPPTPQSFSENPVVLVGNFESFIFDGSIDLMAVRLVVQADNEVHLHEVVVNLPAAAAMENLRRGARLIAVCHWERIMAVYDRYGTFFQAGNESCLVADAIGPDWTSNPLGTDPYSEHGLRNEELSPGLRLGAIN